MKYNDGFVYACNAQIGVDNKVQLLLGQQATDVHDVSWARDDAEGTTYTHGHRCDYQRPTTVEIRAQTGEGDGRDFEQCPASNIADSYPSSLHSVPATSLISPCIADKSAIRWLEHTNTLP